MSILNDLRTAKMDFDRNAIALIQTSLTTENIESALSKLDELVDIIVTGRGIGVICQDADKQMSDLIVHRINTCIDVLTGTVPPNTGVRKLEVIEHVDNIEREVVPVLTMKQKVRKEWEARGRAPFEKVSFSGYQSRRGQNKKVSRCSVVLPIGWRGQMVPEERYNAEVVMESMRSLGADSLIITYEPDAAAKRIDIALWRLTTKEPLKHVRANTGAYIGQLVKVSGRMVHLRPLWLNTAGQVTLSSTILELELAGEIINITL